MSKDRDRIFEMGWGFMPTALLGAAAELDVFTVVGERKVTSDELAEQLECDRRGMAALLNALCALDLMKKKDGTFFVEPEIQQLMRSDTEQTMVPGARHWACIMRSWSQLAWAVKTGVKAPQISSILGPMGDRESFVSAMHSYSSVEADDLVAQMGTPRFTRLLDVGGASGTWTLALLRTMPEAEATIFDLPDAISLARKRVSETDMSARISFAAGDFYRDDFPEGFDYAWVSAIIHQHDRQDNRELFKKVHKSLVPGGRIGIRDVVMNPDKTSPAYGAFFAVNMLTGTKTGTTFTFEEIAEDLMTAGFHEPRLLVQDDKMNSVVDAMA